MDSNTTFGLLPGERLDDLQRFGTDSVLLADFAAPRRGERAVDLGCGTGAIALLMAGHQPAMEVDAVELQADIADMAARSVALNALGARVRVHALDMREAWRTLDAGRFSLAVCNPPYGRSGAALESLSEAKRLARHEGDLTPGDVARAAAYLAEADYVTGAVLRVDGGLAM